MSRAFALAFTTAAAILAGCTSSQDVLEPSALVSNDAANPLPQAPFPVEAQPATTLAAIHTDARIRFAPVVGATAEASAPLSARLAERAAARGITLAGADDGSATHVMTGYFSAITEDDGTTVIYVWDVTDAAGARIHRLQGQAKAPGAGEGWAGVGQPTMEAIADQTVDQLAAWLLARQG